MGLLTSEYPQVDPQEFLQRPYTERLKFLATHWAQYGFGFPKITQCIYIVKLVVFYSFGGIAVGALSSHLNPLHPGQWFFAPIFYEKAVLWTLLLECLGMAGSWGPLAGHIKPMTAGYKHYSRVGTIRLPPWGARVPLTKGDSRELIDVLLYAALIASLIAAIVLPAVDIHGVTTAAVHGAGGAAVAAKGLVRSWVLITSVTLLGVIGLRDKVIFIAARGEQYAPAVIFMGLFPFVDMIVAAKLLIVSVWMGAAFSKINHHFPRVLAPMVSNTPWITWKRFKRAHYANFPEDLRPSTYTKMLAHGPGVFGEIVPPLILLFSHNHWLTLAAVIGMVTYHLFIISTFPLAVPLEWNVLFMYLSAFLFLGFPAQHGYGVSDMGAVLLAATIVGLVFLPVLGNLRPDLVSFLPSMRQYAGNWASAMWAFAPGAEQKLDSGAIKKASTTQVRQLAEPPLVGETLSADEAEVVMTLALAWRSMHSQGRGLNSVMINTLGPDIDSYTLREAEFGCNAILGFNFGDGHLHDHRFIEAIQRRVNFAPGEFIVVWVESEPVFHGRQHYWVYDAAIGFVERGSWSVREAVSHHSWLPDGPVPVTVDWRLDGYQRVRYGRDGSPQAAAAVNAASDPGSGAGAAHEPAPSSSVAGAGPVTA